MGSIGNYTNRNFEVLLYRRLQNKVQIHIQLIRLQIFSQTPSMYFTGWAISADIVFNE